MFSIRTQPWVTATSMSMSGFSLYSRTVFSSQEEVDFPDYGKTRVHQAILQRRKSSWLQASTLVYMWLQAPVLMLQVRGPAVSGQASGSWVAMGSGFFSSEEGKGNPRLGFCCEVSSYCAFWVYSTLSSYQWGWDFDTHLVKKTGWRIRILVLNKSMN